MDTGVPAVLFVDDQAVVLRALQRSLSGEAYDVVTVTSGREALEVLEHRRIDVLVADEVMPEMTGSELLAIASERYPHVRRVVLTGKPSLESALFAINECQVYRYLCKPIDPIELQGLLRAAIRDRQRTAVRGDVDQLTPREREVVTLISRGIRVKDAADALHVSEHTVRNHLKSIFRKLNVHSQAELVLRYGPAESDGE